MLTAYDATFAKIFDGTECVDILLVGDSLGMVIQGHENTLPVTLDEAIYHTRAVSRATKRAQVLGDLPFMTYPTVTRALDSAGRLVQEGGAQAIKLEGGTNVAKQLESIVKAGIPVMGHIGLTPQSVHKMGGFKTQGKTDDSMKRLWDDAHAVQDAGCYAVVLEGMPATLAQEITKMLKIPTIGIGAGPHCNGQVLVSYDMLGMNPNFKAKFVKTYDNLHDRIRSATIEYASDIVQGTFPGKEHSS